MTGCVGAGPDGRPRTTPMALGGSKQWFGTA
jgi:hypothetical protein